MNSNIISDISRGTEGYVATPQAIVTFEVEGIQSRDERLIEESRSLYSKFATESSCVNISGFYVPMWGEGDNLYPQEVSSMISENKILPSIIEKQIQFLFGKGPKLYKESINDKGKISRQYIEDPEITAWLESWESKGYPHYWDYLRDLILDYYHVKTCVSHYHFNRSRRLGAGAGKCIDALSYVGSDSARLATDNYQPGKRIKNSDCHYVVCGDWLALGQRNFEVYRRLDVTDPLRYPDAIAFNSEKTFGRWVYAYNEWFKGLKEWIKASNLTPKYLNSYLKNALNAHVHVIIPGTWYNQHKNILESICRQNIQTSTHTPEYRGVKLLDSNGKPYAFVETMMDELIRLELTRITHMMSGEGKNQGKLYATTKWGDEGWKFEEFPGKFQEYFKSVIDYDKRSDQVVLAGKGINSSITNVEGDAVLSKSGSDVYYNYVIYLNSLTCAEHFICKELNRAIRINFPRAKKEGIKIGFYVEIPEKVQDISPKDRIDQQVNPIAKLKEQQNPEEKDDKVANNL